MKKCSICSQSMSCDRNTKKHCRQLQCNWKMVNLETIVEEEDMEMNEDNLMDNQLPDQSQDWVTNQRNQLKSEKLKSKFDSLCKQYSLLTGQNYGGQMDDKLVMDVYRNKKDEDFYSKFHELSVELQEVIDSPPPSGEDAYLEYIKVNKKAQHVTEEMINSFLDGFSDDEKINHRKKLTLVQRPHEYYDVSVAEWRIMTIFEFELHKELKPQKTVTNIMRDIFGPSDRRSLLNVCKRDNLTIAHYFRNFGNPLSAAKEDNCQLPNYLFSDTIDVNITTVPAEIKKCDSFIKFLEFMKKYYIGRPMHQEIANFLLQYNPCISAQINGIKTKKKELQNHLKKAKKDATVRNTVKEEEYKAEYIRAHNYAKKNLVPMLQERSKELFKDLELAKAKKEKAIKDGKPVNMSYFQLIADFRKIQTLLLYCLQNSDGNRPQNFSEVSEGVLYGLDKTPDNNYLVVLGTVTKPDATIGETYLHGLKNKWLVNNISLKKFWLNFLCKEFIPMRTMFLSITHNVHSDQYENIVWKTRPLFLHSVDLTDGKLDITEFEDKFITFYLKTQIKGVDPKKIICATATRHLIATAVNITGGNNEDMMGHSYDTSYKTYDMERKKRTIESVDRRYKVMKELGEDSDSEDDCEPISIAEMNKENQQLQKEQEEFIKIAKEYAAPLQTNKNKTDHFGKEVVRTVLSLKFPHISTNLLNWKLKAERGELPRLIMDMVLLTDNLKEISQKTIVKFRPIKTDTDKILGAEVRKTLGRFARTLMNKTHLFNHVSVILFLFIKY